MHIPDGYLSPSTCAGLYAASVPFWYAALRRVRNLLSTRTVPLLSVFSAFSFVVMMFNLPLPGGTTGHAVGMGIAAVVLGPWFSLLAISTALAVQALLFGDGGVTTFGANCFNMAVVGSFAAYATYLLVAHHSALTSRRRVVAAGLGGYLGINLAALCAAIEFGLQPRFFHDAAGVPLYAPYPLHLAVPAMLLGHLTFAGLAEFILSAGLVAYLQRADPALLSRTAPDAPEVGMAPAHSIATRAPWIASRKLWLILGFLLVLTPLGILATGTAWGEWRVRDFKPAAIPAGLLRMSSLWRAPLRDYAPSFIRSPGFGYFLCAAAGVGAIILLASFAIWLTKKIPGRSRIRKSYLEKTIDSLLRISEESFFAEGIAQSRGFLQRIDPRVKLVGLGALILSAISVHRLWVSVTLFLASVLLAFFSRIPLRAFATRVWLAVLAFTGMIALPALFLVPGVEVYRIPVLGWTISDQGLIAAAFLLLRAETAATLVMMLLLTTRWNRLLRALRIFRVPVVMVVVFQMTYRYLFVFLRTASDLFEARRARLLGPPVPDVQRTSATAIAGVLLEKSFLLSSEVYLAMEARGFRGEVRLLDDFTMQAADWLSLAASLSVASLAVWIGR
ncbi:MAG: cobalt transporter CbiM [Acidobacteriota bacterium]|nr:cobalt transporter CbiM [Acidobacteriota bacterium]